MEKSRVSQWFAWNFMTVIKIQPTWEPTHCFVWIAMISMCIKAMAIAQVTSMGGMSGGPQIKSRNIRQKNSNNKQASKPTNKPTNQRTNEPTNQPTNQPNKRTNQPTKQPNKTNKTIKTTQRPPKDLTSKGPKVRVAGSLSLYGRRLLEGYHKGAGLLGEPKGRTSSTSLRSSPQQLGTPTPHGSRPFQTAAMARPVDSRHLRPSFF